MKSTNISVIDTRITTLLQAMLLMQNLNAPSSAIVLLQNTSGSSSLNPNSTISDMLVAERNCNTNSHIHIFHIHILILLQESGSSVITIFTETTYHDKYLEEQFWK